MAVSRLVLGWWDSEVGLSIVIEFVPRSFLAASRSWFNRFSVFGTHWRFTDHWKPIVGINSRNDLSFEGPAVSCDLPQQIFTVLVATIPFKMFKDVYFPKKCHFYSLTLRKESMAVVPLAIDAAPCSNVALDFGWRINRYWSCHQRMSANAATNERLSSHGVASSVSLKSWCSAAKFSSTFFTHSSTFNPFQS